MRVEKNDSSFIRIQTFFEDIEQLKFITLLKCISNNTFEIKPRFKTKFYIMESLILAQDKR